MNQATQDDSPKVLYHYTSTTAFRSMLESRRIWSTRYDQLNDSGELQFGISCLRQRLLQGNQPQDVHSIDAFTERFLGIAAEANFDVHIASFSAAMDSLEQWRAYAPSGGVAIGFDRQGIERALDVDRSGESVLAQFSDASRLIPPTILVGCEYIDAEQDLRKENLFGADLSAIRSILLRSQNPMLAQESSQLRLSEAVAQTFMAAARIKHTAYRAEQEWRFISFLSERFERLTKLNARGRTYIEIPISPEKLICEVWISPHGDKFGAANTATFLKRKLGLRYKIIDSRIPYRS